MKKAITPETLFRCGFKKTGYKCYQLFDNLFTCTAIFSIKQVHIFSSGLTPINNDLLENLVKNGDSIENILDFIRNHLTTDDGETPGFDATEELKNLYLPEISHDSSRELLILTWGRKVRKSTPHNSQKNFNAAILNGRRKGLNLKKLDGRSVDVQNVVERCSLFPDFVMGVIKNVEKDDLKCISINCSKGRHRSVAGALLLKKHYYPNAQVIHLEIK